MLNNKYTDTYNRLINRAKLRILESDTYSERHHIIPKCLGGPNTKDNLVNLLPKEHFIAHLLLTKMYQGEYRHKMLHAFSMMLVKSKTNNERISKTSRLYHQLRQMLGNELALQQRSRSME